jgi:ABC-type multidrug transport system ATPase subunit
MDEAYHCDRIVLINEGKIVLMGRPDEIIRDTFPDRPDAGLNDVFIRIMSKLNS